MSLVLQKLNILRISRVGGDAKDTKMRDAGSWSDSVTGGISLFQQNYFNTINSAEMQLLPPEQPQSIPQSHDAGEINNSPER